MTRFTRNEFSEQTNTTIGVEVRSVQAVARVSAPHHRQLADHIPLPRSLGPRYVRWAPPSALVCGTWPVPSSAHSGSSAADHRGRRQEDQGTDLGHCRHALLWTDVACVLAGWRSEACRQLCRAGAVQDDHKGLLQGRSGGAAAVRHHAEKCAAAAGLWITARDPGPGFRLWPGLRMGGRGARC